LHVNTDRIEKSIVLRAPRSRVWQALTDSTKFGAWFGVALDAPFVPGERVYGHITHEGYQHCLFEAWVVAIEPEHTFTLRWHPYAIDVNADYSGEPTTLVEFQLEAAPEGTRLRVIESGFDQLPPGRRVEAFRMNDGGWEAQMENVRSYVGG
jgi:uncharacterized protein YndB with AHSA1/START domain